MEYIVSRRRGDVLEIILDRPERLNAGPPAMWEEVSAALADLQGARAVLISGAGRAFCAGADLGDADGWKEDGDALHAALTQSCNPALLAIADLPVPIVSAVRGAAAGFGCSVALAADFCVAGDTAFFLQAFVNLGLVPDGGSSWSLPRLVGRARATEMMMLGERIPASTALAWGMIHRVVPDDKLDTDALALAERLARGPTVAYGVIRRQLHGALTSTYASAMATEADNQRLMVHTMDAREGRQAFLDKRQPRFAGR